MSDGPEADRWDNYRPSAADLEGFSRFQARASRPDHTGGPYRRRSRSRSMQGSDTEPEGGRPDIHSAQVSEAGASGAVSEARSEPPKRHRRRQASESEGDQTMAVASNAVKRVAEAGPDSRAVQARVRPGESTNDYRDIFGDHMEPSRPGEGFGARWRAATPVGSAAQDGEEQRHPLQSPAPSLRAGAGAWGPGRLIEQDEEEVVVGTGIDERWVPATRPRRDSVVLTTKPPTRGYLDPTEESRRRCGNCGQSTCPFCSCKVCRNGTCGECTQFYFALAPKRKCRPPGMPVMMHPVGLGAGFNRNEEWVSGCVLTHGRDGKLNAPEGVIARGPGWYASPPLLGGAPPLPHLR